MITYENRPIDTSSSLYKIYRFFWDNPYAKVIPNEIMPVSHTVYYTFMNVKNLRDGTNWPPLTLEELEEIISEEFPDWEDNVEELTDQDYLDLGINIPIKRARDY